MVCRGTLISLSLQKEVAMLQQTTQSFVRLALLALVILYGKYAQPASAQAPTANTPAAGAKKKSATPKLTDAQKIALAMSAGPAEITKNATISDMTEMEMTNRAATQPKQLRAGTNGWVCFAAIRQPMCLDKEWQKWAEAWMSKTEPKIEGIGIGYMLRGDNGASNADPYATAPTADNQWVISPAHVMVLVPDPKMLDSYPTDPKNGGPWVMWKGAPYAHIMLPVSPTKAATMTAK
jgi:hypothetical protein